MGHQKTYATLVYGVVELHHGWAQQMMVMMIPLSIVATENQILYNLKKTS